jgi:hypothetical protein
MSYHIQYLNYLKANGIIIESHDRLILDDGTLFKSLFPQIINNLIFNQKMYIKQAPLLLASNNQLLALTCSFCLENPIE